MFNNALKYSTTTAAALAATLGLAVAGSPARAQDYYPANYAPAPYDNAYTMGQLIVRAPRVIGRSEIGAPIVVSSESRVVPTADLDLSRAWGARVLSHRIDRAAWEACRDLDQRFQVPIDSNAECVARARRTAMIDVEDQLGFTPPTWSAVG